MADQPRLQRALRLLQILGGSGWVTARGLRKRLDGRESPRTILRTLTAIEEAGIPLERRTAAHGELELRLPGALRIPPHRLSTDEALAALVLAQFGGHFAGSPMGEVLAGLIDKLEQLLPWEGLFAQAGLEDGPELVRVKQAGQVAEGGGLLLALLEAILERRVCQVEYRRLDGPQARSFAVHAHSLIFHAGAIYALVWQPDHQSWLHLALQRLGGLEMLPATFERRPDFRLADFINGSFGIWHAEPCAVRLRFDRRLASFLKERVWHPTQEWAEEESGDLLLSMTVGLSPELRAWVLRWGAHVEVLEPSAFREEIRLQLALAAARYLPARESAAPAAADSRQPAID
jgi:predicted DNA-binding transcriptional regulator YafY